MSKRCLITSELRPYVKGYKVKKYTSTSDCLIQDRKKEYFSSARILIISSKDDGTASYFESYIKTNGIAVETIFVEDVYAISGFIHNLQSSSNNKYPSIYYRGGGSSCEKYNDVLNVLHDLLNFYPGIIINRPSRLSQNFSKPLQMTTIAKISTNNIKSIPTILSNCLSNLPLSLNETIIKSISSIRSIVVNLTDQRIANHIKDLACPVHLQPEIKGINIRVHVCGDKVYAMSINAEGVLDYRYGDCLSMVKTKLPSHVAKWCVEVAKNEGLEFAGIDLIYEKITNSYWVLEINPTPGYHFFEQYLIDLGEKPEISEWLLQKLINK